MHTPTPPTDPPQRSLRQRLSQRDIEAIVLLFYETNRSAHDVVERFNITLAQLEEVLSWPEASAHVASLRRLATLRANAALEIILPAAIDRLYLTMLDECAPSETRRKAAGALIRLHQQRARAAEPETAAPSTPSEPETAPEDTAPKPDRGHSSPASTPAAAPTPPQPAATEAPPQSAPARASPHTRAA